MSRWFEEKTTGGPNLVERGKKGTSFATYGFGIGENIPIFPFLV